MREDAEQQRCEPCAGSILRAELSHARFIAQFSAAQQDGSAVPKMGDLLGWEEVEHPWVQVLGGCRAGRAAGPGGLV